MSSAVNALIPQLANYDPASFALRQQQLAGNIGLNAAQQQKMQAEVPLVQQQTQGAALQNQLLQQQIADQKAIGQAWASWDQDADPDGRTIGPKAIKLGATPQSVMAVEQHRVQYASNLATADKTTLENHKAKNDDFAGKIQAIIEAPTDQQDQMIANYKGALLADDPAAQIPDHFDLNMYKSLQKVHQYQTTQAEQALKAQQTKTSAAQAEEATAKATHQQAINKLIETGNQAAKNGQNPIDSIFPADLDQATHNSYAAAWQAAGQQPPDENGRRPAQDSILSAAASHAAEFRKATSPVIQQAAANEARLKEAATADIKTQIAVNTQRALNSTAAVGNVPPHLIPQYQGEVAKVASAYGDAANAANEMQEMIDMMRSGNKIAYAYSPVTGVLTVNSANGTRRVNMAEIRQYGGAGSLLDNIAGFFGKKLSGEGVPSDIVDAMEQFHGTLGENSHNTAVAKIKSLNAQYGATTDPDTILVKPTKAAAPPMHNAAPSGRPAPAVGTISRGYRFKGGDPSKQENWEKQ